MSYSNYTILRSQSQADYVEYFTPSAIRVRQIDRLGY